MHLLLVKTSSLGDVIHALAALTDAARAVPGLRCDWVVEEAYAEIPGWHPAVGRVIPCALRRWRKAPRAAIRSGEWARFRAELSQDSYDLVVDAQGLLKSALLAALARGPVSGRSFGSIREPLAALFYSRRLAIDLDLAEVEQLRELMALAIGYARPAGFPDFGLEAGRFSRPDARPYAVFQHAASWPSKLWQETHWQALGRELREAGLAVKLPWGTPGEREVALRIAAACGGEVLPALGFAELAGVLAGARFVVGLDTGITHLAAALGVRSAILYGPSVPVMSGVAGGTLLNLVSSDARQVDVGRPNTVAPAAVSAAIRPWLPAG